MRARVLLLTLAALAPAIASAEPVAAGRLEHMVDDVLAAPEYRHLLRFRETAQAEEPPASTPQREHSAPSAAKPVRAEARERPSFSFPDLSAAAGLLRLLVYAALAVVLVWILVLVARLLGPKREPPAAPGERAALDIALGPASDIAPDESLRQALAHARAGRHRDAIRLLLLGGLGIVERRGLIRYRKGLTNRDYVRAAGREPALRNALEGIVLAFDEVHFGRREATPQRFEDCLNHYRTGLQQS